MATGVVLPAVVKARLGVLEAARRASAKAGSSILTVPSAGCAELMPIDESQSLNLRIISAVAPCSYLIGGLIAQPDGVLSQYSQPVTVGTANTIVDTVVPLITGSLYALTLTVLTPTVVAGNTWAQLWLQAGMAPGGAPLRLLISEYMLYGSIAGWPGNQLHDPLDSKGGAVVVLPVTVHAWELDYTVPAYQRWRLISGWFTILNSDPAVGSQATVSINDGHGNQILTEYSTWAQPHMSGGSYVIGADLPPGLQALGQANIPVPADLVFDAGTIIRLIDESGLASDTLSATLYVEQLINP